MHQTTDRAASTQPMVDLTNCDREEIQHIGAVQSVGFLIAATADLIVAQVSVNAPEWFGRSVDELLGASLNTLLVPDAIHTLRNRLSMLNGPDTVERAFGLPLFGDARRFDVAMHRSDGKIILEGEPSESEGDTNAANLVRTLIARLQKKTGVPAFIKEAARHMRVLTGYDRVMVYRFHKDGSGEVVAEERQGDMQPFLGLRYPASDIPQQARALLLRNPLRIIADVTAAAVPVMPLHDPEGRPLDLSLSVLRSHSLMHVEYLRNMGVGATMTVSIYREGRLWGLFSCHHRTPYHVGYERRTAAELYGQMVSLILDSRERAVEMEYETAARRVHERMMTLMATDVTAFQHPSTLAAMMGELIACDGVGVWIKGQATLSGQTPIEDEFLGLVQFLNRTTPGRVYETHHLGSVHEPARGYAKRTAGLMSIPVSQIPRDHIVFFRREVAQSVIWAGEPVKVTIGEEGTRLGPRKSFNAWQEVVRGQSNPWSEPEIRVAESLRVTFLEVILRMADMAEADRRSADERQALLVGELNHRVRNILGLIRGLISQSRSGTSSVTEFASVLGNRVQALARAHDQITTDRWGPAPLRQLIEAEASAFHNGKFSRLSLVGPDILLLPQAFSTLALVIHELITNSAKYGALCREQGRIRIDWILDPTGNLVLDWVETGGPPVQAPTRRGFGSTIIERSIPHDLGGQSTVNYHLAGLSAHLVVPVHFVIQTDLAASRPSDVAAVAVGPEEKVQLTGRALLVEDNLLIALDVDEMLLAAGVERVDTAAGVDEALRLIGSARPDFAVLDVNLGKDTSFPVADELAALGIPYVFASGYSKDTNFPDLHSGVPVVGKPYTAERLVNTISQHLRDLAKTF